MEPEPDLRVEQKYRVEYAKSGRGACKGCKTPVPKDDVRIAVMVQSRFGDFKQANWHHFDCFFKKFKPLSTGDIAHFSSIRYEDQKRIEAMIKGAKKAGGDVADFSVEYSKSGRAACQQCEDKIPKDEIRISKLDHESDTASMYGPVKRWFHVECFVKTREQLNFSESATKIPGFDSLGEEDQKMLKKKLPALNKKRKGEEEASGDKKQKKDPNEKKLKAQSDLLYGLIEDLKTLKNKDVIELLQFNDLDVAKSTTSRYELLADCMAYGALERCPECNGQLRFRIAGYVCCGHTEWGSCLYQTRLPKRKPFQVPDHLKEAYAFLDSYKYKAGERLLPKAEAGQQTVDHLAEAMKPSTSSEAAGSAENGTSKLPLDGLHAASVGRLKYNKKQLKDKLGKLAMSIVNDVDRTALFVITNKKEVDKDNPKILEAKKLEVPIVSEDVIEGLGEVKSAEDVCATISKNMIVQSNIDIEKRLRNLTNKEKVKSFKSGSGKSGSGKSGSGGSGSRMQTVKIKGGLAVDPASNLDHTAHVLKEGKKAYSVVLNKVDIAQNKNSFYKIQLLESDAGKKYWVFRSWGRIGADLGGDKVDQFSNKANAIKSFEDLFEERTGNEFSDDLKNLKKQPGKYFPVDIDYGVVEEDKKPEVGSSSLPMPVQELIAMIFDIQKMKQQMLEYHIDLTKMPLGKISKDQVKSAYAVLSDISNYLAEEKQNMTKVLECSNRFYSLIPHDFGRDNVPLINSKDRLTELMEMLDSLLEMELAYDMVADVKSEKSEDPLLQYYEKLNAQIDVVDKSTDEFKLIEKYVKNTHAATHSQYSLEIVDVFKVNREEEPKRYEKYHDLKNRMLLWHGSRTTNYAGILSQGLRIAPPEAPVTGYMFGKGVYFADMVSKSANYCCTNSKDNLGLLLLNEVALGNMWELNQAKDVKKLPKGKHSVKGVGTTMPNPEEYVTLEDGLVVPCGKPVKSPDEKKCSLLYNEYIVYDVAQIRTKYLLKVKFDYKF